MSDPADDGDLDPQRWRALAVCLVAGFMTLLDISIVNVALPSIREGTGASTSGVRAVGASTVRSRAEPAGRPGALQAGELQRRQRGIGSGLVISPNLTLTVSQVPVPQAGAASGVMQTGQRMGIAAGIALIGAVFFGTLSSSRGDYAAAVSDGLRVTLAIVVLALVAGIVDVVVAARRHG